jgi:hypothetical protein
MSEFKYLVRKVFAFVPDLYSVRGCSADAGFNSLEAATKYAESIRDGINNVGIFDGDNYKVILFIGRDAVK